MRKHLLVLCILGLLCVRASADSTPHWLQVHTAHFTVITDSSERQARHVAGQLERMQAVFNKLIPAARADTGAPIIVLALKNRNGFRALEPADYLGKGKLELAGFFMPAQDKSYILLRLDTEGEHPFSTIYHEYTHYITRHATFIPLWLNEGLAEFYQNTDIYDKEVLVGEPSPDDILYLRQQQLLPLTTLLTIDHNSPYYHEEQKGSIFYSESWALTHYLEITDFNAKRDRLHDYLVNLANHQDSLTAAQNAFGDLKKLESQLRGYIANGDYQTFKMSLAVAVNEASFKVDPLPTPDADAIRADVLVDNQRSEDAQALLDSVLKSDPGNALAHESEGLLHFHQHDLAAARQSYGEAVALHSTSFLAYFHYAILSLQLGTGAEADIEDSLRQSLKLNPGFAPANDALARLYGEHHKNLDDALMLSILAVQSDPTNVNYRINNAQIHMERNEISSALGVLDAARSIAASPSDLAQINLRTEQIKQYQAQLARMNSPVSSVSDDGTVVTTTSTNLSSPNDVAEKTVVLHPADDDDPHYPAGPPTGPRHMVRGILHNVHCSYPTILTFTIEGSGKPTPLYTNNMYKITYTAGNFTPTKSLNPCQDFEGMTGSVIYSAVSDKRVAGQIISIQVSK
ncbi:MAG TPA: tetratricopeptide repeat protein [Acidobacteriaceae bacterium]